MTNKELHISFSPHHRINAQGFLETNKIKKNISFKDNIIDVAVNLDIEDELNLENIEEELTCLIICIIKQKYLKEYIDKKYKELYENEVDIIYKHALTVFDRMENVIKDAIKNKICNYLSSCDYLNIEGFLTFRLKETLIYLSSITDIALEEYLSEKEQSEFINVLKYFIDIQDSKLDLLVVNILKNGSFVLYDGDGNKIDNIDDEEIINMAIKEELNYEDFLISTLLALCPKKVQIIDSLNNESSKLVIETIKSIFGDRANMVFKN
ncbi:putative sporulation protein YtxC [Romboutsia hominis]|uniref:Sporulation protein YtxC n=1 Tax=Romboutsia faecis TaxID=2764597 RepID=A0ABR7JRA6_9FIRM|nr:putative sporulation protein YtxC [Romboutsia faecis]MBC5997450.1 putative sporulation protein YtxC [Romboutsia faecis]